ncbi:MAG: glycosyltransferase family 39 protein [Ferruginibacter sp.]
MKRSTLILALLILIYLINGICSINADAITSDEGSHLSYGIRLLKRNPERTDPEKDNSKMPISVLNALPRAVEQLFTSDQHKNDFGFSDTIHGRYVTLLFSILIILLVFTWSRELYGINAGLFSAFLFVFCPNNLANAILVTTDTYAVFFLLATLYALWKYSNQPQNKYLIWFALLLGLSQLAKQSLFHLFILAPLCYLCFALVNRQPVIWGRLLRNLLLIGSISWFIINAGFLFYGMNRQLGEYHFMSVLFNRVQQLFPPGMPVPFSSAFITGLDQAKFYDQLGGGFSNSSFGNVTILGHSSTGGSFWYYYLVTLLFKTPLTYLVFFGWSIYLLVKKTSLTSFVRHEFFLLAPVIYYLVLMSFFYKTQCGIRHIIFIYPFLFILSGILLRQLDMRNNLPALLLLCIFLLISTGRYFNNYFAYTNELIGDKKNAWRYVGAANLNFGQANFLVKKYLEKHPDVKMAAEEPGVGKFLLPVDRYLDIWNTGQYAWLRKLQPVDEVEYCYLLFEVKAPSAQPEK